MTAPEGLPVLPPLKSSHQCRRCGRWLEGEWPAADPDGRRELDRQMAVGRCDECTWREAAERAALGLVVQPVPDPGSAETYAQLVLAGTLIDLAGRPLHIEACTHGEQCGAEYHVTGVTDPLSLVCPRCQREPWQQCKFPRPSKRAPLPKPTNGGRPHRERELLAQTHMDSRAAQGDLSVPAPWPASADRRRKPNRPPGGQGGSSEPPNGGRW